MSIIKRLTLRIKTSNYDKIEHIAEKNRRSVNGQIDYIIDNFIDEYEKFNGKIDINKTKAKKAEI